MRILDLDSKGYVVQWNALNVLVLVDSDYYLSIYSVKKGRVVKLPRSSYLLPYVYSREAVESGDTDTEIVRKVIPRRSKEFLIGYGTYYIGVFSKSTGELTKLYWIFIGLDTVGKREVSLDSSTVQGITEEMRDSFNEWRNRKHSRVKTVV